MKFTVDGGRYKLPPGATGDQWFIFRDGPSHGRDGSLRTLPAAMPCHNGGGRYVLTGELHGHRRIYQWEPAP